MFAADNESKIKIPWSNVQDAQDDAQELLGGFIPPVKIEHSIGQVDLVQLAKDNPLVTAGVVGGGLLLLARLVR